MMQTAFAPSISARAQCRLSSNVTSSQAASRMHAPTNLRPFIQFQQRPAGDRLRCSAVESKDVAVMRPSAPVPYSDRDPYQLPREITAIQAQLKGLGWNREWVEQITDRIMKKQLRTTAQRTTEVIQFLQALGLQQDEICNMAFISTPLLGLSPEKQLLPVIDYLKSRGVPANTLANLLFKHPKLFEYRLAEDGTELSRKSTNHMARVRVDVVPTADDKKAANVTYYRAGASFTAAPISPWVPPTPPSL